MKVLVFVFSLLCTSSLFANNIQVSNVALTGQNTASDYTMVKFDLSWENSWRISVGPANWDAAWVFVKYRVNNGDWMHARLNYTDGSNDGHSAPAGSVIRTANDGGSYGLGVFIYRSAEGSGDNNWQNIQLRWNYGLTGVGDNDLVDVQVFAIEMVYVPQASFYLGGGSGSEIGKFYSYPSSSQSYLVNSEGAINVGATAGYLYYPSVASSGDQSGPIPAAYPKGYGAFYCMKYETSQDQWVAFFNSLNNTQKTSRDITDATRKNSDAEIVRNTVAWSGSGNATTTTPNRPVNYVSWLDANAYLDWAALRPMTELEYEKACRGTLTTAGDGFAWGNSNIHNTTYSLMNDGTPTEMITNPAEGVGNAAYNSTISVGGPLRCGIFAASAVNKNRQETGGSYYGIMELSGNVYERMVTAGNATGRSFTGLHGDGVLTASGAANVPFWITTGGYRGGSYANIADFLRVSDRYDAASSSDIANGRIGFRGVRTAN